MKKIYITLVLFFISILTFSQSEVVIPKGINKIKLNTDLSEKDNISFILKVLKENDFDIQKIDTTYYQIQTLPRNLKSDRLKSPTYTLSFNVYNGYVTVTGRWTTNLNFHMGGFSKEIGNSEILNKGMNGSPLKETFKEMNDLCLKIVNQNRIEYTFKN